MMYMDAKFGGLDDIYRYTLERVWDKQKPKVLFVMLNPSTADARVDDPTIRRCIAFAQKWGYGGLLVGNVFALRSPNPETLRKHLEVAVGPDNDFHLQGLGKQADKIIAAWGGNVTIDKQREWAVIQMFAGRLYCLKKNQDGTPAHPLYLSAELEPQKFVYA